MAALRREAPGSKMLSFTLRNPEARKQQPRLGRLCFQGRTPIDTPHYVAVGSRGAVPHLSQDMMREHTSITSMYAALEDCEYPRLRQWLQYSVQQAADMRALLGARKL